MRLTRRVVLPTGLEMCLGMRPLPPNGPQDRAEVLDDTADGQPAAPANTPSADNG